MPDWNYVIVEGFCMVRTEETPCGREISSFCLGSAVGLCPYFACAEAQGEREVAKYVPLYLILWDRIKFWWEELGWKLRWYFWIKWTWEPHTFKEATLEEMEVADAIWASIDMRGLNTKRRFKRWFPKAVAIEKDGHS